MEKISRTKIVDLIKREDFGAMVNVKGWVRTRRGSKQVNFIALNDGSTINNVQVVVDLANFNEEMLKQITTGACLSVNGVLTESVGSGQKAEVQAREIEVLGACDNTYPLQKKGHSMEFLREIAHLRPRTNTFGAVFRIRHNMAIAIHKFFHEKGFFYFHTPIITGSDCEGAGQMFQVTTMNLYDLKKDENGSIIYDDDFFGKQASLTVSGQLEGELAATALGAIYTFGPTFRAENSNTPRHLAEFWMIEPEVAFNEIQENMDLAEEFIKYCVKWALDNCADDVKFLNDMFDKGLIERLEGVLKEDFVRLPYTEGIKILEEAVAKGHKFEFPVYWGYKIPEKHEIKSVAYIEHSYVEGRMYILPDSSTVWLEPESKIRISSDFLSKREVWLTGSSVFEVKKKANTDFKVYINTACIEVKGTVFSVNQPTLDTSIIALYEGAIDFVGKNQSLISMAPSQRLVYDVHTGSTLVENFPENIQWVDGNYRFTDIRLDNLMDFIRKKYRVEVELDKAVNHGLLLTGTIRNDESMEAVIEKICFSSQLTYKKNGSHYLLMK